MIIASGMTCIKIRIGEGTGGRYFMSTSYYTVFYFEALSFGFLFQKSRCFKSVSFQDPQNCQFLGIHA